MTTQSETPARQLSDRLYKCGIARSLLLCVVTVCILVAIHSVGTAEEPAPAAKATSSSADVTLIAAWLTGSADVHAESFERPFGDAKWLTDAKDTICFTDVQGATLPPGVRPVPYDFIKFRMERVRSGHKTSPAVLITRTIADEPAEGGALLRPKEIVREPRRNERYYYIEVAIGNMAWHRFKIVVYEIANSDKPRVAFMWSAMS